jgi:DNA-binding protein HU-beta
MTALNKTTFIDAIAAETGESKAATARFLDAFIKVSGDNLAQGNDINIMGFGSLKVTERAGRTGRNPATGETIQIAASKGVRFATGAGLKAAMNPAPTKASKKK